MCVCVCVCVLREFRATVNTISVQWHERDTLVITTIIIIITTTTNTHQTTVNAEELVVEQRGELAAQRPVSSQTENTLSPRRRFPKTTTRCRVCGAAHRQRVKRRHERVVHLEIVRVDAWRDGGVGAPRRGPAGARAAQAHIRF